MTPPPTTRQELMGQDRFTWSSHVENKVHSTTYYNMVTIKANLKAKSQEGFRPRDIMS